MTNALKTAQYLHIAIETITAMVHKSQSCHQKYKVFTAPNRKTYEEIANYYSYLKDDKDVPVPAIGLKPHEYRQKYPAFFEQMLERQILNIERLATHRLFRERTNIRMASRPGQAPKISAWGQEIEFTDKLETILRVLELPQYHIHRENVGELIELQVFDVDREAKTTVMIDSVPLERNDDDDRKLNNIPKLKVLTAEEFYKKSAISQGMLRYYNAKRYPKKKEKKSMFDPQVQHTYEQIKDMKLPKNVKRRLAAISGIDLNHFAKVRGKKTCDVCGNEYRAGDQFQHERRVAHQNAVKKKKEDVEKKAIRKAEKKAAQKKKQALKRVTRGDRVLQQI